GNIRRLSTKEALETIEDCAQCNKQWKNPTSTIFDQTIANLKAQLVENEVVRVMIPKCMSWLDAYDKPISDMEDKYFTQGITNRVACRDFFQENECEFFTEAGDGARIILDCVRLHLMRRNPEVLRKFPKDDF
nr:hypothetical protein [Tanacetum cinerariifolium]